MQTTVQLLAFMICSPRAGPGENTMASVVSRKARNKPATCPEIHVMCRMYWAPRKLEKSRGTRQISIAARRYLSKARAGGRAMKSRTTKIDRSDAKIHSQMAKQMKSRVG